MGRDPLSQKPWGILVWLNRGQLKTNRHDNRVMNRIQLAHWDRLPSCPPNLFPFPPGHTAKLQFLTSLQLHGIM